MKSIGTPELNAMFHQGNTFSLINVVSPDQYSVTNIPGSKNVPVGDREFAARVEECVGSKDATVVVYCTDSTCDMSNRAAEQLESAGFTDVREYSGGALAWQKAGGLLAKDVPSHPTASHD